MSTHAGRKRLPGRALAIFLAVACAMLAGFPVQAQQFPALSGRVVDAADVIPADVEARLDQKLATLETRSRRQLVVATIPDLEGYEIADYGYRLGRHWGIGDKERNDGTLLIVAPGERKLRIEVGYGLEGILTDGLSSLIINQTIVPRFKAGDMAGGIEAGADAIIAQLTLPEDQARQIAAEAGQRSTENTNSWFPAVFFLFFFLVFIVLPAIGRRRRAMGYRSEGLGPIILWSVADAISRGASGGGRGWSGGGGFSGGGGSFGGGGSSGSW